MVYESDFYTSRRPYSRPTVSSYSVTTDPLIPISGLGKGPYLHTIPFIGHKRLTQVSAPAHIHVRPSIIHAEMDRIQHRSRPHISFRPTENYLNSRSAVTFDDETRNIRAQTQALLRRINAPVPRTHKPLPISSTRYEFDYEEPFVTSRITSDAYIERLLGPVRRVQRDVESMSRYPEPGNSRRHIGKGHLACISFAGGRAFSRRKGLSTFDDRISDDVTYLSHYKKNRNAASGIKEEGQAWNNMNALIHGPSLVRSRFYKPSYSNEKLTLAKEASPPAWDRNKTFVTPTPRVKAERQSSRKEEAAAAAAAEVEDTGARMNRRKKEKQEEARLAEELALAEENEKAKEQARKAELARQEEMAQQAALERQAELERKAELAQEEEIARQIETEKKAEKERKAEAKKKAAADKQAEAERKAEEERIAAEQQAEAARIAEEEKKAEEARIAAEKQAEADRIAEEEKKAEAERLEADAKAAEAAAAEAAAAEAAAAEAAAAEAAAAEVAAAEAVTAEAPEVTEAPVVSEEAAVEESAPVEEAVVEESAVPTEESTPVEADEPVVEVVEAPVEEAAAPAEAEVVPEEPAAEEPVVEEPETPTEESPACEAVEEVE